MAEAKPTFTPLKRGTHVHWPYRGAIGDGVVEGVDKLGTTNATTRTWCASSTITRASNPS